MSRWHLDIAELVGKNACPTHNAILMAESQPDTRKLLNELATLIDSEEKPPADILRSMDIIRELRQRGFWRRALELLGEP